MTLRADHLVFEKRYPDGSGVEYNVALTGDTITIVSRAGRVALPTSQLLWLRAALARIAVELGQEEAL